MHSIASNPVLRVRPWTDPVVDRYGVDPRSTYVELFWLPTLGPSTTWLLRQIARTFDATPKGFELDCVKASRELGLSEQFGRHGVFARSVNRLVQFGLANELNEDFLVRRFVPPLHPKQVARLSEPLRVEHDGWTNSQQNVTVENLEIARKQCRVIVIGLRETGLDPEAVERRALRSGFHPAIVVGVMRDLFGSVPFLPRFDDPDAQFDQAS